MANEVQTNYANAKAALQATYSVVKAASERLDWEKDFDKANEDHEKILEVFHHAVRLREYQDAEEALIQWTLKEAKKLGFDKFLNQSPPSPGAREEFCSIAMHL